MREYQGMKRCLFCEHFGACGAYEHAQPCKQFESAGVLPEVAVDMEGGSAEASKSL